jgi:hypothetical protein
VPDTLIPVPLVIVGVGAPIVNAVPLLGVTVTIPVALIETLGTEAGGKDKV